MKITLICSLALLCVVNCGSRAVNRVDDKQIIQPEHESTTVELIPTTTVPVVPNVLVLPEKATVSIPSFRVQVTGVPPKQQTAATLRWDATGLEAVFDCIDDGITANMVGRDNVKLWRDDCIYIRLNPSRDHITDNNLVMIQVTAGGVIHDARGENVNYNIEGLDTSVSRTVSGWRARIRMPWAGIGLPRPKPGDIWDINLSRMDQPGQYDYQKMEESAWMTELTGPNRWAHIIFAAANAKPDDQTVGVAREILAQERLALSKTLEPLKPIVPAKTGGEVFNIVNYGAVGDGVRVNTAVIQKAVDDCAAQGGGTVLVPAGIFISGSILLKSNINFHLAAGAMLKGTGNVDDYAVRPSENTGFHTDAGYAALLTGLGLTNVSITGQGILDNSKTALDLNVEKMAKAGRLKSLPPNIIYLYNCERVLIEGITAQNSTGWTIHTIRCRDLAINRVTVINPWDRYNSNDGIDVTSCRNVRITGCYIDTGDDGICLKSTPLWGKPGVDDNTPRLPCEDVIIANCVVGRAHGGVTLGAETLGGIRNVTVENCIFDGTRAGIRIYGGPQGLVENIRVNNIVMRRVEWVIFLGGVYFEPGTPESLKKDIPPTVCRNIHFSNITATKARIAADVQDGVRDISFSNMRIEADAGFDIQQADGVVLDDVAVECRGVPLLASNVRNLEVSRLKTSMPMTNLPIIQLARVDDAWIHDCKAAIGRILVGLVGEANHDILVEKNRIPTGMQMQAKVEPVPEWSSTSHAFTGSLMGRINGSRNPWLPVTDAVLAAIRREWPPERIDGINEISRAEPNAYWPVKVTNIAEQRRLYIIESGGNLEKLVIFEDGTLLHKINDPNFHAYGGY